MSQPDANPLAKRLQKTRLALGGATIHRAENGDELKAIELAVRASAPSEPPPRDWKLRALDAQAWVLLDDVGRYLNDASALRPHDESLETYSGRVNRLRTERIEVLRALDEEKLWAFVEGASAPPPGDPAQEPK